LKIFLKDLDYDNSRGRYQSQGSQSQGGDSNKANKALKQKKPERGGVLSALERQRQQSFREGLRQGGTVAEAAARTDGIEKKMLQELVD